MTLTEIVLDHRDSVKYFVFAVGLDFPDDAREVGVQHESVLDDRRFGKRRVDLTALEPVAHRDLHGDCPVSFGVERGYRRASADERARLLLDRLERTLDAVENVVDDARSEQDVHRRARARDRVARLEACRLLIHLDRGQPVGDADDLADKILLSDVNHFHHLKAVRVLDGDNRTVDSVYYIIVHIHSSLSVQKVQSTERAAFSTNHSRCASSLLSSVSSAMMPMLAQ